jgi:DNA-binding NarL/FixJ family response regulator
VSPDSHGLPGVLGEIAEIAGLEAALAISDKVGGTRAYIARRPDEKNWLVQAVGTEAAAKIADYFTTGRTGAEIEFPIGPASSHRKELRRRRQKIAGLVAKGLSNREVARQAGMTRRGVVMFKARHRDDADDPQGDLGI